MSAQLVVDNVSFSYGPTLVLNGVSATVGPGDRIGVIGPNGSGKSTLLSLMAGHLTPDKGRITTIPADAGVGLVTQQLDDGPGESVEQLLARRSGLTAVNNEFEAATRALSHGEPGAADRYDRALARYVATKPESTEARFDAALVAVGLDGLDRDRPTTQLSGGQRTKLNLASMNLSVHDILLLDEPTNDLDLDGLERLQQLVADRSAGLVVISHDRAFLEATITSVLELDGHDHAATLYHGGFDAWQTERRRARERHEQQYQDYVSAKTQIEQRIDRTQRWSTSGANRARRASRVDEPDRNIRAAKIRGAEDLGSKTGQAERALNRLDAVDKPFEPWVLRLRFAPAPRSAERVAALQGAVVRRGGFTLGPVDLEIAWGDRVLITGSNGSGKTTLLGLLLGDLAPEAGTAHLAANARVGRMDQHRRPFAQASTLLAGFMEATGTTEPEARSQLAKLGLGVEHLRRPADQLSPGEQTRALLAVFAITGCNLLVLDEPSNHLDLEAIEELEAALDHFAGTVILVSHDRRLIENVRDITHRVEMEHISRSR